MRKITKFLIAVALTFASCVAICTAVSTLSEPHYGAQALDCEHEGKHYTGRNATTTSSGVKEYWVCCKCHQHYFKQPSTGTWTEGGKAPVITDKNDDRYIPKTKEYDANGFKYSDDGKTITDYSPVAGVTDVVIPEGVESITNGAFNGSSITSITLPSTLKEIGDDAFANTDYLTSVVIPGSVDEIAANAFLDNPNGLSYLFGSGRDITLYLEITKEEAQAKYESGWDNASSSYILGTKVSTNKATVYYKGQWHYDAKGNPVKN